MGRHLRKKMNRFQILKFNEGQPCPEHKWKSIGGRQCPVGMMDCSQPVYQCSICNTYDYGDVDGPAYKECSACKYYTEKTYHADQIIVDLRKKFNIRQDKITFLDKNNQPSVVPTNKIFANNQVIEF
jgi:hypothetical protein